MRKMLLVLNLVVAVILSCGWVIPACGAAIEWFDWSVMSPQQRIDHLARNSFPIHMSGRLFIQVSAGWIGAAALYWSLRFSIPPFFQRNSDTPSWRTPGLRLRANNADLSSAILEERSHQDDDR